MIKLIFAVIQEKNGITFLLSLFGLLVVHSGVYLKLLSVWDYDSKYISNYQNIKMSVFLMLHSCFVNQIPIVSDEHMHQEIQGQCHLIFLYLSKGFVN